MDDLWHVDYIRLEPGHVAINHVVKSPTLTKPKGLRTHSEQQERWALRPITPVTEPIHSLTAAMDAIRIYDKS
jgi:hypothetical protein